MFTSFLSGMGLTGTILFVINLFLILMGATANNMPAKIVTVTGALAGLLLIIFAFVLRTASFVVT